MTYEISLQKGSEHIEVQMYRKTSLTIIRCFFCSEVSFYKIQVLWKFQLTSQNPYAELFIGRPHVLTVDTENSSQVEDAVREALHSKVSI